MALILHGKVLVGEGPGFGPLQDEIASLPLSAGALGIPRAEDILPYAFLASATQTLRRQEELLGDREVPVVGALRLAQEDFCTEVPLVHQDLMGESVMWAKTRAARCQVSSSPTSCLKPFFVILLRVWGCKLSWAHFFRSSSESLASVASPRALAVGH